MLGGFWVGVLYSSHLKTPSAAFLVMTRSDDQVQDAVPTQKQEWVTPKISLMEVGETRSKRFYTVVEVTRSFGPS